MSSLKIDRLQLDIIINNDASRKRMLELEDSMKKVRAEMKRLPKDTEDWKKLDAQLKKMQSEFDGLTDKIGVTGLTMKELQAKSRELKMILDRLDPRTPQWKEYSAQLQAVKARMSELSGNAKTTTFTFSKMADGFNRYFGMFAAFTASFAGIILGARKAVDEFNKFDDKVADVMKTTGLAKDEVLELDKSLQKIDTRTSQDDLLSLARVAGKLGIEGKNDVDGFVKAADKIKVALSEDLGGNVEESINHIGKLTDIFKLKDEFGIEDAMLKVGSAINSLGASSTANEGYIVEFTKRMAGVAPSANISIASIMGLGATLDQFGQQSEMSSTAIGTVITKMFKDPEKFAKIAGLSVKDFTELLNTDANEALIRFLDGLKGNNEGLGYMANMLDELGIEGKRSIAVLGVLSNNTDVLRKQQALANEEFEKGTSLTDEFNIKNNTAQAQLEKKRKALALLTRELGEKFAPIMTFSTNVVMKFLKIIGAAIDFYRENARWINTVVAVVVAYTIAVNAAAIANKVLNTTVNLARAAFEKLSSSLKANPFGIAAAAVAGLIVALQKYQHTNDKLNDSIKDTQVEIELEKKKMNDLFEELKKVNPETKRAKEIRDQLNTVYKDYLPNLITEKTTQDELRKIQSLANDELTKSIILKSKEKLIQEELSGVYEDVYDVRKKIIEQLQDDVGLSATDAFTVYNNLINETKQNLAGTQDEIWKTGKYGIALLNEELKNYTNAESAYNMMSNSLKSNTRDLNELLLTEHSTVKEISDAYDALLPKVKDVKDVQSTNDDINYSPISETDKDKGKDKEKDQRIKDLETHYNRLRELENELLQDQKKIIWEKYQDELAAIDKLLISDQQKNDMRVALQDKMTRDMQTIDDTYLANQMALNDQDVADKLKTWAEIDKLYQESVEKNKKLDEEALKEKLEKYQKELDGYIKMANSISKAWSSANSLMNKSDELKLKELQHNNDKSAKSIQELYDKGIISKEEYDERMSALDIKFDDAQKEMQNASAKRAAELALFEQAIATAVAIANGIKLAMSTSYSHWSEAVAAAVLIVGEVVALMATAKDYQMAAPQYDQGNLLEIMGASDGKLYKAEYSPFSQNKIYSRPTLLGNKLVGEKGPELILNAPTTRNLYFNYPELANALRSVYVPQYATGNMNPKSETRNPEYEAAIINMLVKLSKRLDEPIHADVSWLEIKKKSDQYTKITNTSSGN